MTQETKIANQGEIFSRVFLNTGHLGYSPEQEYYTLQEYTNRFRPRFIVLSLFANDFGDLFEVLEGKGDWEEGKYWLGQITQFCRTRGLICLTVPAPWVNQLEGHARLDSILAWSRTSWNPRASPTWIRSRTSPPSCCGFPQRQREGKPTSPNPLFNGSLGDGHFSPLGCDVWARAVAKRLGLLLGDESLPIAPRKKESIDFRQLTKKPGQNACCRQQARADTLGPGVIKKP